MKILLILMLFISPFVWSNEFSFGQYTQVYIDQIQQELLETESCYNKNEKNKKIQFSVCYNDNLNKSYDETNTFYYHTEKKDRNIYFKLTYNSGPFSASISSTKDENGHVKIRGSGGFTWKCANVGTCKISLRLVKPPKFGYFTEETSRGTIFGRDPTLVFGMNF